MTRNPVALVLGCTVLMAAVLGFGAPQASNSLETALGAMDKASANFKGLTADLRKMHHQDVLDIDDVEMGTVTVKRAKPGDTRFLIKLTSPSEKFYSIAEGKVLMYIPKSQEAQEGRIGNSKDLVNDVMLLGFGSNSADLKAAYTVKLGGPDKVNGATTIRVEALPKSPELLKHIKRCDLWITDSGMVVQQKLYETGGDYDLNTYTNMKMAPNLPDSAVKLEIPRGIKIQKLK